MASADTAVLDVGGTEVSDDDSYAAYYSRHAGADKIQEKYSLEDESFSRKTEDSAYQQLENGNILSGDNGNITWSFTVEQEGLYPLTIRYKPVVGETVAIQRNVMLDGSLPYNEAAGLELTTAWTDIREAGAFAKDWLGNDERPGWQEADIYLSYCMSDASGFIGGTLLLYLSEGPHTLTLEAVRGSLELQDLVIGGYQEIPRYEQIKAEYERKGYTQAGVPLQILEAEFVDRKSDISIYPLNDRSSAITSPQHASAILLNTIGGSKWQQAGQWLEWTVNVQEAGLYRIGARYRQNLSAGMFVTREMTIDGQLPFAEAANLQFHYDPDWQASYFGSADEAYLFYLDEGIRTIRLRVVLGDMAGTLGRLEDCVSSLNRMYREIIMITGRSPDQYRDYKFETLLPDTLEQMGICRETLLRIGDELLAVTGAKGELTSVIDKLVYLLEIMTDTPQNIAVNLSTFQSNIGALATLVLNSRNQPLELDRLYIAGRDEVLPDAECGFFQTLWFHIRSFFASFLTDYNQFYTPGTGEEGEITVWIPTGRDQMQAVRQLIDDDFTREQHINVRLQLVTADALMPTTLAGVGPDLALSNAGSVPVNFALRGALMPLDDMPGFDDVVQRFHPSALVPYSFQGKTYALPETQVFYLLFYREDILEELGLDIPETWDEFNAMIPQLQKKNMQIAFPPDLTGLLTLFCQTGEELYKNDGASSNLDCDIALEAFKRQCRYFVEYGFPLEYNFVDRFRTGEMPIGLQEYTTYNTLKVSAPEIDGLWGMAPLPGTVRQNDEGETIIDSSIISSGTGAMMMNSTDQPDAGWKFLEWWTSADVQSRYAAEMEAILGPSAKHPSANMESLKNMSWEKRHYDTIMSQWDHVVGIPEVPGGYMTARAVSFAFTQAYNTRGNAVEILLDYIPDINNELTRKRREFGIGN